MSGTHHLFEAFWIRLSIINKYNKDILNLFTFSKAFYLIQTMFEID